MYLLPETFKFPKENFKSITKYIPEEKCCGEKMKFRWWVDRDDIYHEE